jgi:hypothetical protein
MTRTVDRKYVATIRAEMDKAATTKAARMALARAALSRDNLTDCGRDEWKKELAAHDRR